MLYYNHKQTNTYRKKERERTMRERTMKEKIEAYVEKKLKVAEFGFKTKEEATKVMHMALGAVQFYVTYCDPTKYDEVYEWWSTKREKFDRIIESKVS